MAYKITDACVKCGSCADACHVEAITEGDEKYVIDAMFASAAAPAPIAAPPRPSRKANRLPTNPVSLCAPAAHRLIFFLTKE